MDAFWVVLFAVAAGVVIVPIGALLGGLRVPYYVRRSEGFALEVGLLTLFSVVLWAAAWGLTVWVSVLPEYQGDISPIAILFMAMVIFLLGLAAMFTYGTIRAYRSLMQVWANTPRYP